MTRTRVRHQCEACGAEQPKWVGRCPDCGEWASVVEQPGPVGTTSGGGRPHVVAAPKPLADVDPLGAPLRPTGVSELDRVLGGGARCLLVCAEESVAQVRLRADRLGVPPPSLLIIAETSLPVVLAVAEQL